MIADSQNKALITVAEAALIEPKWQLYSQYCSLREQGLRKKAFTMLDEFLTNSKAWDFETQKAFVSFLLEISDRIIDADYGPLPEPLLRQLIKPTLIKWCELEKTYSTPFRWYGKYFLDLSFLDKALEVNPKDDKARSIIISNLLEKIDHSTHHLPDYYIGDPALAFEWEKEVREHLSLLVDENCKAYWTRELEEAMILVNHYVKWKASGHPNFEEWGQENNKKVCSGVISVYYDR